MIEIGKPAHTEVRFNPLGIFGIGPITTTRKVPATVQTRLPGRSVWNKIEIDFEDADAVETCLIEVGPHDVRKRQESHALRFDGDGWVYILHGLFPLENLRDNVWLCHIDYAEF